MWLSFVFILGGLWLLAWSASKFVDGASAVAKLLGISPFIIGMVVIGFGTSAPELAVSAISSSMGHSDLSLGNAYGSNVFNIAVILGIAALIRPVTVRPMVAFVASPLLVIIAVLSCLLVCLGGGFSRMDGIVELLVFAILLPLYCWFDRKSKNGGNEEESGDGEKIRHPWLVLLAGLVLLALSSHILVWGSVSAARTLGVSELLIGLTIIAAGTSLPELAAGIASARKGEPDFVLGNIIGSNFFNTLAVVGLSGTIQPFADVSPYVLVRDLPVMVFLSLSIGLFGVNYKNPRKEGRISRWMAGIWLLVFVAYMTVMFIQELH
ncbi:MAG: calcium/sodium antiporter [Kiritimatiellae bacterium]|nr:calcium/sodium antiporter [Kiritimatiellia bacterium]